MLITCPHCGAAAKLKEIPPIQGVYSVPRYRLTCSNCVETVVGDSPKASGIVTARLPAVEDGTWKS